MVQKGVVPGIPGCKAHTSVVTQLIREQHKRAEKTWQCLGWT